MEREATPPVLCTDLDGTVVATDLLYESFASVLRERPLSLWRLPVWLADGRPRLKRELAARAAVDAEQLPFHREVVEDLVAERERGRRVVLATASHQSLADGVAAALGVFHEVIGTDAGDNLKGARKKATLDARYGVGGYEYVGDSEADLAVWNGAALASCVGVSDARAAEVARLAPIRRRFEVRAPGIVDAVAALGPGLQLANGWIALPLVLGSAVDAGRLVAGVLALVAMTVAVAGLGALVRLPEDRLEAAPRRPFAAGRLPLVLAIAAVPAASAAALAIAVLATPPPFVALVAALGLAAVVGELGGVRWPGLRAVASGVGLGLRALSGFALG